MLPLAGAVAVDGYISHRNASMTASVVQDRLLLGSARIVAEQLRIEDGALQDHIPPAALELFDSADGDRIYYRVTAPNGQMVSGYSELALPINEPQQEIPEFFDATVRARRARVVAFLQPVLTDLGTQQVLVQIAQTMEGHEQLTRSHWRHAMVQQLVILALAGVLIMFGLHFGLQPLLRLRDAVLIRETGTFLPLPSVSMPTELAPLVIAINDYAERLDRYTSAQQVFIQNAAHQLRTPLTLLKTQVSFAVRSTDSEARDEALTAVNDTVQQAGRLVNQLLTLSAAESHEQLLASAHSVALDTVLRGVLESLSGLAQSKNIDLGFEMSPPMPPVAGHAFVVREMATNLVDNAIRYTQPGGIVTIRLSAYGEAVSLVVEDNGPGISADQRERVFERFYRVHDRDSGGCGLGLSIVREFANRMDASVALSTPPSGRGLAVEVRFMSAPSAANV
jgi:two-component system sensor histidine kinase TctE